MAMTSAEITAAIAEGKAAVDGNDWSAIKAGIAESLKGADVRKHIYAEAHAASMVVEEATEAMADYPELKADLIASTEIEYVQPTYNNYHFIDIYGVVELSENMSYSSGIQVNEGDIVYFECTNENSRVIATFSKVITEGSSYAPICRGASTGTAVKQILRWVADEDCSVSISAQTTSVPKKIAIIKKSETFKEVFTPLINVGKAIVVSTGEAVDESSFCYTDGIALKKNDTIIFTVNSAIGKGIALLSKEITKGTLYEPVCSGSGQAPQTVEWTADEDCNVSISTDTAYAPYNIEITREKLLVHVTPIINSGEAVLSSDGTIVYDSIFSRSRNIYIPKNGILTYTITGLVAKSIATLSVVSDNTIKPVKSGTSESTNEFSFRALNDCYVTICSDTSYFPSDICVQMETSDSDIEYLLSLKQNKRNDPADLCTGAGSNLYPMTSDDSSAGFYKEIAVLNGIGKISLSTNAYGIATNVSINAHSLSIDGDAMAYQDGDLYTMPSTEGSRIIMQDAGSNLTFSETLGCELKNVGIYGIKNSDYEASFPTLFDPSNLENNCGIIIKGGHCDQNKFERISLATLACGLVIKGQVDTCTFDNINFDGCNTGLWIDVENGDTYAINTSYKNCVYADMPGMAIFSKNSLLSTFENNVIAGVGGYITEAMKTYVGYNTVAYIGGNSNTFRGNVIRGAGITNKQPYGAAGEAQLNDDCYALVVDGDNCVIDANKIYRSNGYGILLNGSYNTISHNSIDQSNDKNSIVISGDSNNVISNIVNGSNGKIVINSDYNTIVANRAENIILNGNHNKLIGNFGTVTNNGTDNVIV